MFQIRVISSRFFMREIFFFLSILKLNALNRRSIFVLDRPNLCHIHQLFKHWKQIVKLYFVYHVTHQIPNTVINYYILLHNNNNTQLWAALQTIKHSGHHVHWYYSAFTDVNTHCAMCMIVALCSVTQVINSETNSKVKTITVTQFCCPCWKFI